MFSTINLWLTLLQTLNFQSILLTNYKLHIHNKHMAQIRELSSDYWMNNLFLEAWVDISDKIKHADKKIMPLFLFPS